MIPENFKKPKIITLIILFASILVIHLGLKLLSTPDQEIVQIPIIEKASPTPKTTIDPELEKLAKEVSTYNNKLGALDNYLKKLSLPATELDISFE